MRLIGDVEFSDNRQACRYAMANRTIDWYIGGALGREGKGEEMEAGSEIMVPFCNVRKQGK